MSITDAFLPLLDAQEGDQIYLRTGHQGPGWAGLALRVRRGAQLLIGDPAPGGWHLVPCDLPAGRGLDGYVHWATARRRRDGGLWLQQTGAPLLPLMSPTQQPARGGEVRAPTGARCKSCRAPIVWMQTAAGAVIPVDWSEHAPGPPAQFDPKVHTSHFATCPQAEQHRREMDRRRSPSPERVEVARETIAARRLALDPAKVPQQPAQELGWPDRVARVRTAQDAEQLLRDLQRKAIGAVVESVEHSLAEHLVTNILPRIRERADQDAVAALVTVFLSAPVAARLLQALGEHVAALEAERPRAYQGGEERLDAGE